MKIESTRYFTSEPGELPRTPPPAFAEGEESAATTRDVGADWLAATGVVDAEREALLVQAARVAAATEPQSAGVSDAWLDATGAGFAP